MTPGRGEAARAPARGGFGRLASRLRGLPRSGAALAGGYLLLGAVLMASVVASTQRQSDATLLRRALAVEADLGDLRWALLDAEVGQRGYLLTGDADFLGPYRSAAGRLEDVLARLDAAVVGSTDEAALMRAIRILTERKRAELAETLARHDAGDEAGALRIVRDGTGMALMDAIRARIHQLEEMQGEAVARRERSLRRANTVSTVTAAVSFVLMAVTGLAALAEVRRRARLARFLPAEVAERLAGGDRALDDGRTGPATVAFVDIRGFTALAEDLPPATLSALLTAFRRAVSEEVRRQGGMVDKFIGDGALAVFGAFEADGRGAARAALRFAEGLGAALPRAAESGSVLRYSVGLHHGIVFCGVVGSDERREFTVLGDAVNVASRIEAANRQFGTDILASEAVLVAADEDRADGREVSRGSLRGHRGAVPLFTRA